MKDISKLFILVAMVAIFIGVVLGFVALVEVTHRNQFYREPVESVVTDISTNYVGGYIDTTNMVYIRGYHDDKIVLDDLYNDECVVISPAFIPHNLNVGDTVRLYRAHSGGLFDFNGSANVIEYNGEFLRSY